MTTVAKKAAARKPAVKAATPRVVKPKATLAVKARTIVVAGRTIEVKKPTAEQLMMWAATIEAIGELKLAPGAFQELQVQLDRYYRIASAVFVKEADRKWLEDGRIDGTVSIEEPSVIGMLEAVTEAYEDELPSAPENRAARRAAARKKA